MHESMLQSYRYVGLTKKSKNFGSKLPSILTTTVVIFGTLNIYSCVTNATLEITSEGHQANYDLVEIKIKRE